MINTIPIRKLVSYLPSIISDTEMLMEAGSIGEDILELKSQQAFNANNNGSLPCVLSLQKLSSYWIHDPEYFIQFVSKARMGLSDNLNHDGVYVEVKFDDEHDPSIAPIKIAGVLHLGAVIEGNNDKDLISASNAIHEELLKYFSYKNTVPSLAPTPKEFPLLCDVIQKVQKYYELLPGEMVRHENNIVFPYMGMDWVIKRNCDKALPDDKTLIDVCNSNGDLLVTVIAQIKSDI